MLDSLPKDLREMSEEQFVETFEMLRRKTNDFSEVRPDLLKENSQFLTILRCITGLTRPQLAKSLGLSDTGLWWFESGHRFHRSRKDWVSKLGDLLKVRPVSIESALEKWREFKRFRSEINPRKTKKRPKISELSEDQLKGWFDELSIRTTEFERIAPEILFENPQNIEIFRLLLRLNIRRFSKMLGRATWTVRKWENGIRGMRRLTAVDVANRLQQEIQKLESKSFDRVLKQFRIANKIFFDFDLEKLIDNGLALAEKSKKTKSEGIVEEHLDEIVFEQHATVEGIKKKFNVDFAIPSSKNFEWIIETFMIKNRNRNRFNIRLRMNHIDHKFQAIKLKHPKVKTVLFILFTGKPILESFMHKSLEMELLNTDFLLLNDEIKNLKRIISN